MTAAGPARWRGEGLHFGESKVRAEAAVFHWEQSMTIWSRLFYCQRCDHVYDPTDHDYRPIYDMRQLLTRPLFPGQVLSNAAAQPERPYLLPIVVGAAVWAVALALSLVTAHGQALAVAARTQEAQRLKAPLAAQYRALLPAVDADLARGARMVSAAQSASAGTTSDQASEDVLVKLNPDLDSLSAARDAAQKAIDAVIPDATSDPDDAEALNNPVQDAASAVSALASARQTVESDLSGMQVGPPTATAPGLTMRTLQGGGASPRFDPLTGTVSQ